MVGPGDPGGVALSVQEMISVPCRALRPWDGWGLMVGIHTCGMGEGHGQALGAAPIG